MNQVTKPSAMLDAPNSINGQFQKGSGAKFSVLSPWFGEQVGESWESNAADLEAAVAAAQKAFPDWSLSPLKERAQVLFRFRDLLLRDIEKIAQIISLENGKLVQEAKAEILKGVEVLEFALSLQNLDCGGKLEVSRGVFCEYRREPLGIVSSITPFNFPAMVPLWTIPISIALGNAFLWKPSEKTPLTSKFLAAAFQEAGLPTGIFQVLQGSKEIVNLILQHPAISAVSFVGSTKIAQLVYETGSVKHKRVLALGGAKNHIFLFPDAELELTGKGIADSFTGCAGQRCMAASVLLPVGDCEEHIRKIVANAAQAKLGKDMGAIITKAQVEFLHKAIAQAESAGAKILLDGRKQSAPAGYEGGNWLGPTVLDHVTPSSQAACVELFGPVLSIVRTKSLKEAMKVENDCPYGNAASVFTNSGDVSEYVAAHARAGMIGINVGVPVPREPFSFGGIQDSKFGYGDITGENSLNFWSNPKKITTKWQSQKDATWMS